MFRMQRYIALKDFKLEGDPYKEGSTFIYEDAIVCNLLRKSGLIQAVPNKAIVEVKDDPLQKQKYLSQLTKKDLLKVAENENVTVDEKWSKTKLMEEIKRARIKRGECSI